MKSNNNRTEIVTAFTLILGEFFLHKIILTAAINKENTVLEMCLKSKLHFAFYALFG